jgi:hypothetical protein
VFDGGRLHPVGKAAIADLAMAPGPQAQDYVQAEGGAQPDEGGNIQVAIETHVPLDLFVVDPEDVAGHHGDAAGLHQPQPLLPPCPGKPAEVDFS